MNDVFVFNVFAAGIGALTLRGAWNAGRRRRREAFSVWLMALVWAVFWCGFDGVATATAPQPIMPVSMAAP